MITLIDNPKTNHLCESFQANEIKFAFASPTDKDGHFQLIMLWVKCREYFNELFMSNYHPDKFGFSDVHGFRYDQKKFPMDMSQTLLALKFPNKKICEAFKANIGLIHKVEEFNSVSTPTEILPTKDHNIVLVKASKFWQQKALLMNLYTLLIKLCSLGMPQKSLKKIQAEFPEHTPPTEIGYVTSITPASLDNILQNLTEIVEIPTNFVDGSDEIRDPYSVHGYSGILHLCKYTQTTQIQKFGEAIKEIMKRNKPIQFLSNCV